MLRDILTRDGVWSAQVGWQDCVNQLKNIHQNCSIFLFPVYWLMYNVHDESFAEKPTQITQLVRNSNINRVHACH